MRLALILAFTSFTAGCAGADIADCRGANWYDIGFRDGLFGLQRMDVAYNDRCSGQGAQADPVAYAKGWQEGLWELESRRKHGGTD
jgi:hypothetical protein